MESGNIPVRDKKRSRSPEKSSLSFFMLFSGRMGKEMSIGEVINPSRYPILDSHSSRSQIFPAVYMPLLVSFLALFMVLSCFFSREAHAVGSETGDCPILYRTILATQSESAMRGSCMWPLFQAAGCIPTPSPAPSYIQSILEILWVTEDVMQEAKNSAHKDAVEPKEFGLNSDQATYFSATVAY